MGDEKQKQGLYAIFVHAGAGYHSREHEAKHLDACRLYVYPILSLTGLK
jgi:taspase (threonine aspartase 1)